jgi:hypothetical protein
MMGKDMVKEDIIISINLFIKEIGKMIDKMEMGYIFGLMDHFIKEIGRMGKDMGRENSLMQTDLLIKETGEMIKKMGEANIFGLMEQLTKEIGRMVKCV